MELGIIKNKELIENFGNATQKKQYKKKGFLSNNQMQVILNKISRFCKYEKVGDGEYNITHIYDTPKPACINKLNKGLYQYIAPLIMTKLLREHDKNNKATFPILTWAKRIDMVNNNYTPIKYNKEAVGKEMNIDYKNIAEFFKKSDESIRYYMEGCLKLLDKADVLKWYKVPMLRKRVVSRVTDEGGGIRMICDYEDVKATDEDVDFVLRCVETARLQLGIKNKIDCYYSNKASEYKAKLGAMLKQKDILYMYDCYEVFYTSKTRGYSLLEAFSYKSEEQLTADFNQAFIDSLIENAEKRQIKSFANEFVKDNRVTDVYLANITTLSELTIDRASEELDIKEIKGAIKLDNYDEKINEDFNIQKWHRGRKVRDGV